MKTILTLLAIIALVILVIYLVHVFNVKMHDVISNAIKRESTIIEKIKKDGITPEDNSFEKEENILKTLELPKPITCGIVHIGKITAIGYKYKGGIFDVGVQYKFVYKGHYYWTSEIDSNFIFFGRIRRNVYKQLFP